MDRKEPRASTSSGYTSTLQLRFNVSTRVQKKNIETGSRFVKDRVATKRNRVASYSNICLRLTGLMTLPETGIYCLHRAASSDKWAKRKEKITGLNINRRLVNAKLLFSTIFSRRDTPARLAE